MAESMLRSSTPVHSDKYDVEGVVEDYGVLTKLIFTYEGRKVEMAIHRNLLSGETFEEIGRSTIETYIENLAKTIDRPIQLHYWYISEYEYKVDGKMYQIGHGIVTGHPKLEDSIDMHTSAVQAISVDEETGELLMTTKNNIYHCLLEYCDFDEQDKYPDIIPDYERLKEKYKDKIKYPSIEPGKVLLVLSDFSYYYFHSVYFVPEDSEDNKPLEYSAHPHVGTFQDSFLISMKDTHIDLRYFPHFQNVEFYSERTQDMPWFIENVGGSVIYAKTKAGTIRLEPGDRKEVKKENAEDDPPILPGGDLYPAGIF